MGRPLRRGLRSPAQRADQPRRVRIRDGPYGDPEPAPEPGTPGNSSCTNRTGSDLPELAGGSRLRALLGRTGHGACRSVVAPSLGWPSRKAVPSRERREAPSTHNLSIWGIAGSNVGRLPQRRMTALYTTLDFMFTNAQAYR